MPANTRLSTAFVPVLSLGLTFCLTSAALADDYLWLEEVESPEAGLGGRAESTRDAEHPD